MASKKLTVAAVDKMKAPAKGRLEVWDTEVPGLGLRVTERGIKSWSVFYRVRGDEKKRRLALGRYPELGLTDARDHAREAKQLARRGRDPAKEYRDHERAEVQRNRLTLREVGKEFRDLYRKQHNAAHVVEESRQTFEKLIEPELGDVPIHEVRRRDVHRLLDQLKASAKPYRANMACKELRTLFRWALDREYLETNPLANLELPVKKKGRERVLDEEETAALWKATADLGYPYGDLYRFLLLTGQRREEAAQAQWSHFDLDAGTWTIPRELCKSDRAHEVPLPERAVELLRALPHGPFVFSSSGGKRPVGSFSKAKDRLDKAMEKHLEREPGHFRVHDLRRTAASGMASAGVEPHVLSRVLNHAPATLEGVTAIYNRYGYQAEKRRALEAWADRLMKLVGEKQAETAKVVALHG